MFDQLGWTWVYEPIDLAGYIPDFILQFKEPLLIEIKPALTVEDLLAPFEKIRTGGWTRRFAVLGAARVNYTESYMDTAWGMQFEPYFGVQDLQIFRCGCGYTPCSTSGNWSCGRGCDLRPGHANPSEPKEILKMWRAAGNTVQWRK